MAINSGEPVPEYLLKTNFNGIFGQYTFDKHGDIVGPQHVLRIIQDGKSELLEEVS